MAPILTRWKALPHAVRLAAALVAAVAAAAAVLVVLLQRDVRAPLFAAPLRADQVAEVAERLAGWNVAYDADAENVRVDARTRNDLLLRLALVGVPHAHLESSADALAKASPLTPPTVLDAQVRDGLAGDLASALRGVAGVADARIIIAPARPGVFADDPSQAATASVRLTLAPGATLPPATLDGVRRFVAAGVPGLAPERVALLDDRGTSVGAASAPPSDDARELERSLQSALDGALGAGAAIVRVRVTYDPRARETHETLRRPLDGRAIASSRSDERYVNGTKRMVKSNAAVDRGSDERDVRVNTPPGDVARISVAIAVDAARRADLEAIRALARATLGLDERRGDIVTVEAVSFPAPSTAPPPSPFAAAANVALSLAPAMLVAAALVVAARCGATPAFALVTTLVERAAVRRTTRDVAALAPAHVRGALANEPPHTAAAIISALPAATATAVLELYPPEERAAIVRRMARAAAPAVPDYESVLRRG
jgi:flagellar M-ring protein FliF